MKVLKFLKSVGKDIFKSLSDILLVILGFIILSVIIVGIAYILGIPIHIIFPQVAILDCGTILIFIGIMIWILADTVIKLIKYLKRKWKEINLTIK